MKAVSLIGLSLLFLCLLSCSGATRLHDSAVDNEYKIRAGDVIEIEFAYYPDFNQTVFVKSDGTASFDAVGEMEVLFLSAGELQGMLREKYAQMLAMPEIEVNVHESESFTVYIGGDLKKPGVVKFRSSLTLVQGILLAGGLKLKTDQHEIVVFRSRGKSGMKTFKFSLVKGANRKLPRNFQLAPYDVVFVMRTDETGELNLDKKRI